jgi:hypothetical protein
MGYEFTQHNARAGGRDTVKKTENEAATDVHYRDYAME